MTYTHYGWPVSPYSAKTRAYFRFKGIPFNDVEPSALRLFRVIQRAVGRAIMPTVRQPDGTWLQDTSEIIDTLERRYPTPSITPDGPRQRVASLLMELHADEWMPIVIMHTRWNIPENRSFAEQEFGRYGFPWLPSILGRRLARPVAEKMRSYLPILGVTKETSPGIESFARDLIAQLNTHLEQHPFLLGTRPCLGDFSLYGPLWAHCYRDPGSRHLLNDAPAVVSWFDRLAQPNGEPGVFLEDDVVPDTLKPILATLFRDQWPYITALVEKIDAWCTDHPDAKRVPRALGNCDFNIAGYQGTRRLMTFVQWMAQRPLAAYADLDENQKESVNTWLGGFGAEGKLDLKISNPFERHNFKMRMAPKT